MKFVFMMLFLSLTSQAWADKTGVGISLGNPTGVNAKHWLSGTAAFDAGAGFSFGDATNFSLHSDYLLHREAAFYLNDVHALDLYYGIGGRMEFSDEIELGARIPVGLAHQFEGGKADMFGEIAPIVDFIGRTGVELHLLFGSRYYF